jgi:uncharacterized protein involved in exopolysaccharide biosynthesis
MEKGSEIDFVAIFWIVWRRKILVIIFALVVGLAALVLALRATPIYRAQVVITEVKDTALGGSGSLANQLGGLASLAGVNINTGGASLENKAVLESRGLIEEFIKRNSIVPLMNINPKLPNPLWFAVEKFKKNVLDMRDDKLKGTTIITMDWTDASVAAQWANNFVALANALLRERAVEDSTRNIDFLNKQITQTNVLEVQHAMFQLIESETKTLMLATGRLEYAFTVVDPAVAPQVRSSPRRTLMVLSGLLIGGILGSIAAIILNLRNRRTAVPLN